MIDSASSSYNQAHDLDYHGTPSMYSESSSTHSPHLSRNPDYDHLSLPVPVQPILAGDVLLDRYPSGWIPIPLETYTNVYSNAFFAAQGLNQIQRRGEIGLDLLRRAIANDSVWDLSGTLPPPCYPNTRENELRILYEWALEPTSSSGSILRLQGSCGIGKSAILRTLAQRLHAAGRLGGSFFSRSDHRSRGNTAAFFCTIAYQLAINVPMLRAPISLAVQTNPAIIGESMSIQLQELILEPCRAVVSLGPLTVVIDGLEGCNYETQREILYLLGSAARSQPSFRFLIASRSEHHAAAILAEPCFIGVCRSLDLERSLEDVRTYLTAELTRIQHQRFGSVVVDVWISTHVLDRLVAASLGCLLYASTLVRFLGDPDSCVTRRLPLFETIPIRLLEFPLDELYIRILAAVPTGSRASLLAVLHILTREIFADMPLYHIEQLLHMKPGRLRRILRHLSAVLKVPSSDSGRITVHHTSFLDFLVDSTRSGAFYIDGRKHSMYLVRCILRSFAYVHENLHVNRTGHIAWTHLTTMVDYIISVHPSTDLVQLIMRINPDFFFGSLFTFEGLGGKISSWLHKIHPRPDEAIRLWEDYEYMAFFHSNVNDFDFDEQSANFMPKELGRLSLHRQILLRNPALIRLLRVSMVLPASTPLFPFRVLLNASWEELRSVICALRPILGREVGSLLPLWTPLQDPDFAREIYPWSSVFTAVAHQSITIVKGWYAGVVPAEMIGYWLEWGRYVRSSPTCFELLRELRGFVPLDDDQRGLTPENEVYDVLKWLKSFPDPPRDDISRWTGFLPGGTEFGRDQAYEARWMSWSALEWYDVA
ncbi:hypothetical protein B0H11DRAFT_453550 [Mycena galericulata]|nr:hypothetical protein B0H11DRAFT_453550 [Mycena galericulata]